MSELAQKLELAHAYLPFNGPIFVGTVLNWCLLGTVSLQVHTYILTYPDDSRRLKSLIWGLFGLEIIQTAFLTHYAWVTLVSGWGIPIDSLPWSGATFPIMSGLIALIVQLFFAWRIWVLRVSIRYPYFAKIMSVLIAMVAMLQGVAAIYGGIAFSVNRTWEHVEKLTWIVEIWLGGSTTCDILIAAAMITILAEASRGSPWKRSAVMINKLMIHAIETGAVTAVTALVDLVLFERYKHTGIHQAPALLLGKLYTSALLVSLNGRQRRRDDIALIQQLSALGNIRIYPTVTEDLSLTLRPGTPNQLDGSRSKNGIVVQIPLDTISDNGTSMTCMKTYDSPV